jgi:fatty acid desaturase
VGASILNLTPEQIEAFGAELAALEERARRQVGEEDAQYIRKLVKLVQALDLGGRALLFAGWLPPAWLLGAGMLGLGKIIDNMEVGHNVMHGQYDFMHDPRINTYYEWDAYTVGAHWRHSHNYVHHKYTNVIGMDYDIGFRIARLSEEQPWHPWWLLNLPNVLVHALLFDMGVSLHDANAADALFEWNYKKIRFELMPALVEKVRRHALREFVLIPLLAGPSAIPVITGTIAAHVMRNLWVWAIIYCGHFPQDVHVFTQEQIKNETRSQWYLRQVLGSANIDGRPLLHLLAGHLTHQIEHHLFPTLPAWRYPQLAAEVRAIMAKYGVPYHSGPLHSQLFNVLKRVARLSLPLNREDALHWRQRTSEMRLKKYQGMLVVDGDKPASAEAPAFIQRLFGSVAPVKTRRRKPSALTQSASM